MLLPDGSIAPADVLLRDAAIAEVGPGLKAPAGAATTDLSGLTLVPGFIDVHVHGGGGFSLATTDAAEVASYQRWVASTGVTSFLATVCAGDVESALPVLELPSGVAAPPGAGANLLGVNLEGPFVSPDRRGALPQSWVCAPQPEVMEHIFRAAAGRLRLMTVAPEVPGAGVIMRLAIDRGVRVSVGHTDATANQALAAFRAGATHLTHAFNGMRPFHHREPGPVTAAVASPGVTIEAIADGVHLHPETVRLLVRAAGADRVVLVTDAVTPAGLAAGVFRIGGQEATLSGGSVRLPDGTLAGSAATMDSLVRNVVSWGVCGLAEAVRMASANPARLLGLEERKGAIAAGFDADLVALDGALSVQRTWVRGEDAMGFTAS